MMYDLKIPMISSSPRSRNMHCSLLIEVTVTSDTLLSSSMRALLVLLAYRMRLLSSLNITLTLSLAKYFATSFSTSKDLGVVLPSSNGQYSIHHFS